jgi:hypothetical protein
MLIPGRIEVDLHVRSTKYLVQVTVQPSRRIKLSSPLHARQPSAPTRHHPATTFFDPLRDADSVNSSNVAVRETSEEAPIRYRQRQGPPVHTTGQR